MATNIIIQDGIITKDLVVNNFGDKNTPTTYFSIAQNTKYGDTKVTNYFKWVAQSKTAENMAKYCKKGIMVMLEGNETTSIKEDKDGNKIEVTRRFVTKFSILTPKEKNSDNTTREEQKEEFYNTSKDLVSDDDLLPF